MNRPKQGAGVTLLKVAAATTTDQQSIAGEGKAGVIKDIGQTAIGMAKQARFSEAAISGMHAQAFLAVKKYDTFKAVLYRLNNHV